MKRGEIYFIRSTYHEEGSEQRADRPAVIVSNNNNNNNHSETVEVVYMTTRPKTDLPTHVLTRSALSPSTILCEQICTVSKQRVGAQIGTLTDSEMQAVDTALAISLALDFGAMTIMREPTVEELEKIAKKMHEEGRIAATKPAMSAEQTADLLREAIKAQTERDVYKELYLDLLEHMKGATNQ